MEAFALNCPKEAKATGFGTWAFPRNYLEFLVVGLTVKSTKVLGRN